MGSEEWGVFSSLRSEHNGEGGYREAMGGYGRIGRIEAMGGLGGLETGDKNF